MSYEPRTDMKTKIIPIHPEFPEMDKLAACAKIIRQGGLVIFPTETVYGVGANLNNPKALARLREVKKRSDQKPFAVLISKRSQVLSLTAFNEPILYKLVDKYWPGPLTVVIPGKKAGETIGVRMPDHRVALGLVEVSECLLAAPSANFENNPAPTNCQEALRDLDGLVDVALDAGPCRIGISSSIVDFTNGPPRVTREGKIHQSDVDQAIGRKTVLFVCTGNSCRSVMAEYLLKKALGSRRDVDVISTGTGVFITAPASGDTIEVLKREGVDASGHLSQPVSRIMLKKADLILVMTRSHRQQILDKVPEVEKRVYLLKEFANLGRWESDDIDISDPMGKTFNAYEECLWTIKEAIEKIAKLI